LPFFIGVPALSEPIRDLDKAAFAERRTFRFIELPPFAGLEAAELYNNEILACVMKKYNPLDGASAMCLLRSDPAMTASA
jgi:hypothetical protein